MAKQSFDLPAHARAEIDKIDASGNKSGAVAIAVKAVLPDDPSELYSDIGPLDELESLAKTAGLNVVGAITQRRRKPHPGRYLGKGKIQELAQIALEHDATIALVDDPISPSQGKNIEEESGLRVIDRAELIMDIFATHAQSHQARLQVELAQLRYSQSRLTRMWTHLSRMEGGIGMRGPGETQLETDRRIIRRKISHLKDKIEEIERQHETQSSSRRGAFKIALVGYTNAGKSTLMRRLTGSDVLVEDRLFSTLDTSTRKWELEVGRDVLLSDTVGFIRKLPHTLVASFHATLMEAREADLLLHIVDCSSAQAESDIEIVEDTLIRVGCQDNRRLMVFNKLDRLCQDREIDLQHLMRQHDESHLVSAGDGTGVDELVNRLKEIIHEGEVECEYRLPVGRGDLVHRFRQLTNLEEERYENDYILVRGLLGPEDRERFEGLLENNDVDQ